MTASQRTEMLVTRREPSDVPVRAVERLTNCTVPAGPPRAIVGHLAQGSLAATAVLLATKTRSVAGLPAVLSIAVVLVGGDAALARLLGLAEAPWKWSRQDLAIDVIHKSSLAIAARRITASR